MKNRKAWLEERQSGIGGSDVAAILGISGAFNTSVGIWKSKLEPIADEKENRPDNESALMWWGQQLEDDIIRAYRVSTGNKVLSRKKIQELMSPHKVFKHPEKPWLIASLDGIAIENGEMIVLEAKYSDANHQRKWTQEEIPMPYYFQVQHYMHVTGLKMAHVAAKIGGWPQIRCYQIKRSDELIEMMDKPLRDFWFNNVVAKVAPDPSCIRDVMLINPEVIKGTAEATQKEIAAKKRADELKEQIKDLENEMDEQKTIIASRLGDKNLLVANDGATLMSVRVDKNGKRSFWLS